MGNALLSFRGEDIPELQNTELPFNWSSADGIFNNIFCNSIEVANPPGPAQVPALEVLEYENSVADFARLDIASQVGGPFLIKTDGAGAGVARSLDITANQDLILTGGRNSELAAGALLTIQNFSPAQILISSQADIQLTYATQLAINTFWTFDNGAQFLPSPVVNSGIGSVTSPVQHMNLGVLTLQSATPTVASTAVGLGNSTLAHVAGTPMLDWVVNVGGTAYRVVLSQ
jgi:hypothetical protein